MPINAKALGAAAGLVAGATFVICALAVAVAPGSASAFLGWVLHIDLTMMARQVTVASLVGGLILFSGFVGICVALTGQLYNRLAARRPTGA